MQGEFSELESNLVETEERGKKKCSKPYTILSSRNTKQVQCRRSHQSPNVVVADDGFLSAATVLPQFNS
jgi:hypothetical protein